VEEEKEEEEEEKEKEEEDNGKEKAEDELEVMAIDVAMTRATIELRRGEEKEKKGKRRRREGGKEEDSLIIFIDNFYLWSECVGSYQQICTNEFVVIDNYRCIVKFVNKMHQQLLYP